MLRNPVSLQTTTERVDQIKKKDQKSMLTLFTHSNNEQTRACKGQYLSMTRGYKIGELVPVTV